MISLLPDSDQRQIADAIAEFLIRKLPIERLRPGSKLSREADCWHEIAELGCFGLGLRESVGGAGFSIVEEVLAFREMGRTLASPAIFATTIAAHAAMIAGRTDLLTALIAGTVRAAPAIQRESSSELIAIDAERADLLLVQSNGTTRLYEPAAIDSMTASASLDEATGLHLARVAGSAVIELADPALRRRGQLLVAAMLTSVGETSRDMAVGYAKDRRQFGRPIGAFQAIKHRCADMAVRSEMACNQLFFAAIHERDQTPAAAFHGHAAGILALDAALRNSAESIQVHGGIGFTAEYDAHRFLKRAHLLEHLGASTRTQQGRLLAEAYPC